MAQSERTRSVLVKAKAAILSVVTVTTWIGDCYAKALGLPQELIFKIIF